MKKLTIKTIFSLQAITLIIAMIINLAYLIFPLGLDRPFQYDGFFSQTLSNFAIAFIMMAIALILCFYNWKILFPLVLVSNVPIFFHDTQASSQITALFSYQITILGRLIILSKILMFTVSVVGLIVTLRLLSYSSKQ